VAKPIIEKASIVLSVLGSEHRSSRTYADRLESWLSSGKS
jgi:hypothetical protein